MKFVFLCDANYLKGDLAAFVTQFPKEHLLTVMTAEEFLQAKSFPEGTFAIFAERFTWQKNFSLFRYLGLLPTLEVYPLGVVSRSRKQEPLKGRAAARNQEFFINPAASVDELSAQLNKFIAAPPQIIAYPRKQLRV